MTERTLPAYKVRENKLRRIAKRQGYNLLKSKVRDPRAIGHGGWTIINAQTGMVEAGVNGPLNTDEVEEFLKSGGVEEGEPSFAELVETGKLFDKDSSIIPIGPRTVVALVGGRAYEYDIQEDAGSGNRVIDYAVRFTRRTRWQETVEQMACDPETWETYAKAKARVLQAFNAINQIVEDGMPEGQLCTEELDTAPLPNGVDRSYLNGLMAKLKKALKDQREAYEVITGIVNRPPIHERYGRDSEIDLPDEKVLDDGTLPDRRKYPLHVVAKRV